MRRVGEGAGRLGECVKDDMICSLNGHHSGICEEASYWGKRLTLAECGRNRRFKNK